MRRTSAFATGLDVVAILVVGLFTFSMVANLMSAEGWLELSIFLGLGTIGTYLTGRAVLNLKDRLAPSA